MIRVVLDTNVVVSALLGTKGLEERVLKLALHRKLRLYVSTARLEEYEQVLLSPRLGLRHSLVRSSLSRIRAMAHAVHPRATVTACSHEEDNRFLECAETAGADFLITGNRRHFPLRWKQTTVVNARQFLELVGPALRR